MSRPTLDVRHSTSDAQSPGPLRLRASALKLPARAGMTMIELVASLALFVVILGILMTVLNSATDLWGNSRGQQREQTAALAITDLIADDLYQAVSDNAPATNSARRFPEYPSFILRNHPAPAKDSDLTVILGLIRPAQPRFGGTLSSARLSVDAIFYVAYSNALFRTIIPLPATPADPISIGELLKTAEDAASLAVVSYNPFAVSPSPAAHTVTRLAERIVPSLTACIPEALVITGDANYPSYTDGISPSGFTEYTELSHYILPDRIDLSLHLFSAEEWTDFQSIFHDDSDDATLKRAHLGALVSRRITLPQAGGSRLP